MSAVELGNPQPRNKWTIRVAYDQQQFRANSYEMRGERQGRGNGGGRGGSCPSSFELTVAGTSPAPPPGMKTGTNLETEHRPKPDV